MNLIISFFSVVTPILIAVIAYYYKRDVTNTDSIIKDLKDSLLKVSSKVTDINESILNIKITNDKILGSVDVAQFKNDANYKVVIEKQNEISSKIKQLDDVLLKVIKTVTILKNSTDKNAEEIEYIKIKLGDDSLLIKNKKQKG